MFRLLRSVPKDGFALLGRNRDNERRTTKLAPGKSKSDIFVPGL